MTKRPSRPKDSNQLAKLMVEIATGEFSDSPVKEDARNPEAVILGRRGGLKGGAARAKVLTPEQRAE